MTTLSALIDKLQAGDGGSRELDAEIWPHATIDETSKGWRDRYPNFAPYYTTSVDAALTLVPDGWYGRVTPRFHSEYSRLERRVVLWDGMCIKPLYEKANPVNDDWFEEVEHRNAATPALALVIASIKARAGE